MVLGLSLVVLQACKEPKSGSHLASTESGLPDEASVLFDITPLSSVKGETDWLASYSSQGKTAKFRLEMTSEAQPETSSSGGFSLQMGHGRFVAIPGSDGSALIADLKKALEAKKMPTKVRRADDLKFTFAILGRSQSRAAGGGFNDKPSGNWSANKVFIGGEHDDTDEGEVFLNLNPTEKKGEFSLKDPDYGDFVLAKLAAVL